MGRTIFKAASAAILAMTTAMAPAPGLAQPSDVVELFTSQGCSSCPPADAYLAELARSDDVVALAYHVDYWDYLGWKDTFGSARNTRRQRAYGRALGSSVYTPEIVVNGRRGVIGSHRDSVDAAVNSSGLAVSVRLMRSANTITVEAGSAAEAPRAADVTLVYFVPKQAVTMKRGENSGKTIPYYNAVTGVQIIGQWRGKAQRYTVSDEQIADHGGGVAVLLQSVESGLPGPIVGAAIMR